MPTYDLRSTEDPTAPAPGSDAGAASNLPEPDADKNDPYYYGWREHWEKGADGREKLCRIPLTYQDLLDPQQEDFVAEDNLHRDVTEMIAGILRRRFKEDPTVAVYRNLKLCFVIPGLTTGPAPDICLITGVNDPDRKRTSFRLGEEPGKLQLGIEVVSQKSQKKDYQDILEVYSRIGMVEYFTVHSEAAYISGPYQLRGWRLDPKTQRLNRMRPDKQGRFHSKTTGLLFGTGPDGIDLKVFDAATGKRLRTPEEEAAQALQAAQQQNREMMAEIERLQAQLQQRDKGRTYCRRT